MPSRIHERFKNWPPGWRAPQSHEEGQKRIAESPLHQLLKKGIPKKVTYMPPEVEQSALRQTVRRMTLSLIDNAEFKYPGLPRLEIFQIINREIAKLQEEEEGVGDASNQAGNS